MVVVKTDKYEIDSSVVWQHIAGSRSRNETTENAVKQQLLENLTS
jgi:hypothetical protein